MPNDLMVPMDSIKDRIYTIRGLQVMLDSDLASLYNVETRVLNQAVKRNIERFPEDFMFQLSDKEFENWKSQIVISNSLKMSLRKKPLAFTEHGITALSGVLRSSRAVEINVQVIRSFISMRRFLASNALVFQRLDTVEKRQIEHKVETDTKFRQIFDAIESKGIKQEKGIFFNGQMFDAYTFISDLVRSAQKSIVLIDNFVDDSVLTLFTKRKKNVAVTIFTKEISKQMSLDLKKHNSQYPFIQIKEFKDSHDRFMIIDDKHVYHIGASLKDVGKKWFAFSKFGTEALKLMEKLQKRDR
jgi:hypothetical protein